MRQGRAQEAMHATVAAGGVVLRWAVAAAENRPAPAPEPCVEAVEAVGDPPVGDIDISCPRVLALSNARSRALPSKVARCRRDWILVESTPLHSEACGTPPFGFFPPGPTAHAVTVTAAPVRASVSAVAALAASQTNAGACSSANSFLTLIEVRRPPSRYNKPSVREQTKST